MATNKANETQITQATQEVKSLDDKISEVINGDSWTSQVKTTLEVSYEIVKAFNELNEHYKKDLEKFNANFSNSENLYNDFITQKATFEAQYESILNNLNENLTKSEVLKSDLDALNANINAMGKTIASQKDEIQNLVNTLNIDDLNAKIADLNTKKTELTAFLPQFDAKKDELKAYLTQTKSDFEQYIADFRNDLDELDFVQTTQPNTGLKGQSWLDTSKGVVNIFSLNPQIRFIQESEPQDFAKLGNGWVNDENELFIFKAETKGNEWTKLHLNALDFNKIDFKQLESVEANAENEGKSWLKMSPLNVYYLENKSFVQIDKKLVRFESESEPNLETETIQLNDIWKKSDDEIFICTQYTAKNTETSTEASAVWTPLNEAYKVAKFQRAVLPSESEIANENETLNDSKVQMRDLVFIFDENELYYCVKNNYSGGDFVSYEWVKKADFKDNARFKSESEPQELRQYDLWYKMNNDGINGTLKSLNTSGEMKLKSLAYVKKYADFRQELQPSFANDGDFWYKPFSNELYRFLEKRWVKINPLNVIYYSTSEEVEVKRNDRDLSTVDTESEQTQTTEKETRYVWNMRNFTQGYLKTAEIKKVSDFGLYQVPLNELFEASYDDLISFNLNLQNVFLTKSYNWLNLDNFSFYNNLIDLDDDEIFIIAKERNDFEWINSDRVDITPLLWQNELENRVKNLEKLHLPNGNIFQQVLNNELVVPQYPQQLANKAYVDDKVFLLEMQMKTSDNDFILCDLEQGLNFYLGKNLKIVIDGEKSEGQAYSTSNTYTLITLQSESDLKGRLEGQSGSIVIENANFMAMTLNESFVSRVALSALQQIEIFSYTIYNGKVYLSRI